MNRDSESHSEMDSHTGPPLSTDPVPERLAQKKSKVYSHFHSWTDIYEENGIAILVLPVFVVLATMVLYLCYHIDCLSGKKESVTKKEPMSGKKHKTEMKQKPESQAIQKNSTKKTKSRQKGKKTTKKEHVNHKEVNQVPKTNDKTHVGLEELGATANDTTSQVQRLPGQRSSEVSSSALPLAVNLQEKGRTKTEQRHFSQGKTKEGTPKIKEETPKNKEETPKTKEEPPKTKEGTPKTKEEPPKTKEEPPKTKEGTPKNKEEPPKNKEETLIKQKMEQKQITQEKEENQFTQEKVEGKNKKAGEKSTQKTGQFTPKDKTGKKDMAAEKHTSSEKKTQEKQKTSGKRVEHGHYTRESKITSIDWKEEIVRYTNMPVEEKRKMYMCGRNITTLSDIPSLAEEYERKNDRFQKEISEHFASNMLGRRKYEADHELNTKVSLWRGDITSLEIDAIVNAANKSLLGGGGVDGAIHRAAGPSLKAECATLHGCDTGEAKITCGYKLPARCVIHTVGPVGEMPGKLRLCYQNSLVLMRHHGLRSVAFPCISTGVFGYPNEAACSVAIQTVRDFLQDNREVERVIFCLFMPVDVSLYEKTLPLFFPEPQSE